MEAKPPSGLLEEASAEHPMEQGVDSRRDDREAKALSPRAKSPQTTDESMILGQNSRGSPTIEVRLTELWILVVLVRVKVML